MECSEFLARFSEFYDGDPELPDRSAFEVHLDRCRSCRRYMKVVDRGSRLFRDLPLPEFRDDFLPRLQHRLFHVDEEETFRRGTAGSGMTAGTAVAVAVLLVFVAWYPSLQNAPPDVELPPIVVEAPPVRAPSFPAAPPPASFLGSPQRFYERGLWAHSNVLLFEYSSLGQRHGAHDLVRAGFPH